MQDNRPTEKLSDKMIIAMSVFAGVLIPVVLGFIAYVWFFSGFADAERRYRDEHPEEFKASGRFF